MERDGLQNNPLQDDDCTSLADKLNTFYAYLKEEKHPTERSMLSLFQLSFRRVNSRKAAGSDGISGRVLRACQLAPMFTIIFKLSLIHSVISTCFKPSTVVPVPKKPHPSCLNDYWLVALTSVVMKCFERLVKNFITSSLHPSRDPLQFACCSNRSIDNTVNHLFHTALAHLDTVDYSSAFDKIIPSRLVTKHEDLGLNSILCSWIFHLLTCRPQVVRVGSHTSSLLTINIGDVS